MRVGINARFLQYPATGSGQNLVHLLESLARRGDDNEYLLLGPGPRARVSRVENVPELVARFQSSKPRSPMAERVQRLLWEQIQIVSTARQERIDVLHSPYFSAPLQLPCPTVVTIHDVITLILPEYRERLMNRLYTSLISRAVQRVQAVIAVSECSARDVHRVLGIPSERIRVIGNAIDATYRPVTDAQELARVRTRLDLPADYLLYLGGFDLRKNLLRVVEAFAQLPEQTRANYPLVIAGRPHLAGHPLYPDPRPTIDKLGVRNTVRLVGEIDDADKPALYSGATLFVWPSLYEGFGIPVLEAMACGVPVITSNSSSLPEVVGDTGRLVSPNDVAEIAQAIAQLLDDRAAREDLRARALARAGTFSWDRVAEQTLNVYAEAVH